MDRQMGEILDGKILDGKIDPGTMTIHVLLLDRRMGEETLAVLHIYHPRGRVRQGGVEFAKYIHVARHLAGGMRLSAEAAFFRPPSETGRPTGRMACSVKG